VTLGLHFRYERELSKVTMQAKKNGFMQGAGVGFTFLVILCTYALALWYGAKRVREGDLTAGDVIICFFGAVMGAMGLGQV
jgi:ATP-binding cassette subfamily B (MDR/TAP) protein 1